MSYLFQELLLFFYWLTTQTCCLTSSTDGKMSLIKPVSAMATIGKFDVP